MIRPEIGLSEQYLDLIVEAGASHEGSFHVYTTNDVPVCGRVLSTNDKIEVRNVEFSGNTCEIFYYFKGRMAIPGEEHFGDFLLLTNAGEYNIPYSVTVIAQRLRYGNRVIANLEEFAEFAREEWKQAKELFFSEDFPAVLLADQEEERHLYHDLLKGHSKDAIMDQFLMKTTVKEPAAIWTDTKEIRIDESKVGRFRLNLTGRGWTYARLYGESGGLYLNKEKVTPDDFEEGKTEIFLSLKEEFEKDILVIENAFSVYRIPISKKHDLTGEKTEEIHKEQAPARLLRYYMEFRTGKMELEEYVAKSLRCMPTNGMFYELYCFLLLMLRERAGETEGESGVDLGEYAAKIEEKETEYTKDAICRGFYAYVISLWKRDENTIRDGVKTVRGSFEKRKQLFDFILLSHMDETLIFDYRKQWDCLHEFLEKGENSPLLYLALLDVLNKEPYLLEQLDENKTAVIGWGLRHHYLSQKLIEQFARLSVREKNFRKNQLPILIAVYEKKKDDLYLKAICSMLMKGNRTAVEYHSYFEEAINRGINLIGLNEFYIRTLDFDTYPVLPKMVLYYFHYSSSLDKREKAWLYLNILLNREAYGDVYDTYLERAEEFVKEQLMEGRMNRHLKVLYQKLLPSVLSDIEYAKYLPGIIFRKKMTCHNPVIEGVYVIHAESEEEVYVPFVDGICQVDIYSDTARYYFTDRMGNRYCSGISYQLDNYLDVELYRDYCVEYAKDNWKVIVKWLQNQEEDKKEQLSRILGQHDDKNSWKREKEVEKILDYHYGENSIEDLSECLDKINYRIISASYRRTLMRYYMVCGRMEDAYFGAELYGSDTMDPMQLYHLTCVGIDLHKQEKDTLLLTMAHKTLINRQYNRDILNYLKTCFEGRVFDLLDLWTILKKEGLEDADYEERVLEQMLFVQSKDDRMLKVLISYLEKRENPVLTNSLLEVYSMYYVCGSMKEALALKAEVPELFFTIIENQVKKGQFMPVMSRLAYLIRKSEQGWSREEETGIQKILTELCIDEVIFPFYYRFEAFAKLPALFKEAKMFWLLAGEGKKIMITVTAKDGISESEYKIAMKEAGSGFYYGWAYLPAYEEVVKVEADYSGVPVFMESAEENIQGSRMHLLDSMSKEKSSAGSCMKEYETRMRRLSENVKFLRA